MTTYSFIDESGETRLVGTISPAPGGGSQPGAVVLDVRTFTETAGAGTYTATVELPANTRLMRVFWNTAADWGAPTGGDAAFDVSDENGSIYSDDVENAPDPLVIFYRPASDDWSAGAAGGQPETGKLYASGQTITCTITSAAVIGTGVGVLGVKYAVDPATANAVKS